MYSPTTSVSKSVLDFFEKYVKIRDEDFLFSFQKSKENGQLEYWSADLHLVPSSGGIWLASNGFPVQVRHLFLSHSAADILCFCHHFPSWLRISDSVAFVALGLKASYSQIDQLKRQFFNAKVHTLFDAGITGRVTDCKVALWIKGTNATFIAADELIHINYSRNRFRIPIDVFSLSRFEKTIGIRSGIRTHKPKGDFNSFYEFFINTR
ncbi:hypothetical protein SAMN05421827_102195 [Pedobacter terrae]|uniref:Uncharacterized protein n=1 Tax=Pedobacter terrae TaxID=405671 RepID=A0A1G7Q6Q9_9SPHI|nr:hypothetical protein [Pedobacter terrae]SDF94138.1 hypothetical protein SAMN05421827_102195 [Pedobacter terrae]